MAAAYGLSSATPDEPLPHPFPQPLLLLHDTTSDYDHPRQSLWASPSATLALAPPACLSLIANTSRAPPWSLDMLASSSPTISASSSPSAVFHAPSRTYHASRRTSASSSTHSPRFAVTPSSRRYDVTSTAARPIAIPSPSVTFAPQSSPQSRKRTYVDAGTQYTPPGLPPTFHPPVQSISTATAVSSRETEHVTEAASQPVPFTTNTQRGLTSAAGVATDPPEPALRVSPQPVAPAQNALPQSQRASKESLPSLIGQDAVPRAESAVLQAPSSPAKRARAQDPNLKVMPFLYETCDVKDLGILISDMLMELVRINDEQPLRDGTLTRFHSRAPPGISVRDYLSRLIVHATLSPPILLSMVFYVDKLCAMYPSFTISSLTVHRFLITAATVAAKGLSDSFWTNSLYARVGGVSVRELALLELEFLRRLDWRIVPKPEVLVDYYKGLVERGSGFALEQEPEAAIQPISNHTLSPTGSATGIQTNQSTS